MAYSPRILGALKMPVKWRLFETELPSEPLFRVKVIKKWEL
jgi:hypothetical protein